jgi:DNA-binding MarR family transcriptional regulator
MAKPGERDHVDRFLDEIADELPESIDLVVEGIVDRIHGINWRIRKMLDETLEQYGLTSGDWKVMSALRWAGKPYRRSAGELAQRADLSSGAMTNRLDHLEAAGLIERTREPPDRRTVVVELTRKGRRLHEAAIGVQAEKEALIGEALPEQDKRKLESLLRRVMLALEQRTRPLGTARCIQGNGGTNESSESLLVNLVAFVEIDGAPDIAFQARVEQARRVFERRALREGHLHHALVGLARANDPIVRPHGGPSPLPLLDHLGVGFLDESTEPSEQLTSPVAKLPDPPVDQRRRGPGLLRSALLHVIPMTSHEWA